MNELLVMSCASICCASVAFGDAASPVMSASLLLDTHAALVMQDGAGAETPEDGDAAAAAMPPATIRFGEKGTWWHSVQGSVGIESESTDWTLTWNAHTFLADDFELLLSFGGWWFDQENDDAVGGSFSFGFRWHFVSEDTHTFYADWGIGLLGASDEVPEEGTDWAFLPRAGVGTTVRLGDGPARLDAGVRWQHISNASAEGTDANPSRDSIAFYVGFIVPF